MSKRINATFVKAGFKKTMINVTINDKPEWCNTSPQVLKFVKATVTPGEEITLVYEEDGAMKNVVKVEKQNYQAQTNAPQPEPTPEPTYTPPTQPVELQKTHSKPSYKSNFDPVLSAKQTAINSTATTLAALAGQVNVNDILSLIDTLFDKYLEKLS